MSKAIIMDGDTTLYETDFDIAVPHAHAMFNNKLTRFDLCWDETVLHQIKHPDEWIYR